MRNFQVFILLLIIPALAAAKWDLTGKTAVAVLDPVVSVRGESINTRAFGDQLQVILVQKKVFKIVDRAFLSKILEEQKLEMAGLTESEASRVGALSGAEKILAGSITKVEKTYYLMVKGIDTRTGQVEISASISGDRPSRLMIQLPALVDQLIAGSRLDNTPRQQKDGSIPENGLILYLPLQKTAEDMGPMQNHGLPYHAQPATNRFSEPKSAFSFEDQINYISTEQLITNPFPITLSLWFLTKSYSGGRMLGFSSTMSDMSGKKDRHLYMDRSGRVHFGVYNDTEVKMDVRSKLAFNNGEWHHAAAIFSTNGLQLYMDGVDAGQNKSVTAPFAYNGYWRVSYDMMNRWPGEPDTYSFKGLMDDIRIYDRPLTPEEIQALYHEGGWPLEE